MPRRFARDGARFLSPKRLPDRLRGPPLFAERVLSAAGALEPSESPQRAPAASERDPRRRFAPNLAVPGLPSRFPVGFRT